MIQMEANKFMFQVIETHPQHMPLVLGVNIPIQKLDELLYQQINLFFVKTETCLLLLIIYFHPFFLFFLKVSTFKA